jgi:transcriptional regulator with XRE-family HTH domain
MVGDFLRNARRESKLTLRDAARKIGMSYTYVSKIENNQNRPSQETAVALAKLYRCDVIEAQRLAGFVPLDIYQWMLISRANLNSVYALKAGNP